VLEAVEDEQLGLSPPILCCKCKYLNESKVPFYQVIRVPHSRVAFLHRRIGIFAHMEAEKGNSQNFEIF